MLLTPLSQIALDPARITKTLIPACWRRFRQCAAPGAQQMPRRLLAGRVQPRSICLHLVRLSATLGAPLPWNLRRPPLESLFFSSSSGYGGLSQRAYSLPVRFFGGCSELLTLILKINAGPHRILERRYGKSLRPVTAEVETSRELAGSNAAFALPVSAAGANRRRLRGCRR
jgi:hypothetical protein